MDVQTLTIKLAADVAEFTSRIKGVEGLVTDATSRMKSGVSGLWASLGAGVSVAGLGVFVRAAINAADEVSKLAQRTGLAVDQVGGLQLAFQQAGAGDKFAESMAKMAKAIADGNPALAAMGINVKNTDGTLRGTREVLADVATKFEGYADGTAKVAIAQSLLGESGAILIPLLNGGGAALDEYDKTAQRLGLTLDTETAKAAEKFNDTLDLVAQGSQGVARGVAAKLLPTLNSLAENFLTSSTGATRLAKTSEFLANILKGLYIGAVAVVEVFSTLGKSFGSVIGAFVAAARGDFSEAWAILKEGGADIAQGWTETAKQMSDAWSGAGGATVAALVDAGAAAKGQAPNVKAMGDAAKAAAKALEEQRKEQEAQAKLVVELSGVQADYMVSLTRLQAQRDAGNLSEAQYIELVTALIAKQPMAKKLMDETAQATATLASQQNQAFDDYFERLEKERLATEARIKTGRTTLEQLQFETSLLTLNTTERELANAMRELERQGVVKGTEAWATYAEAIRSAIIDREAKKEAIGFWQSIEDTAKGVFTDVANVGSGAFERIGKVLKASVLDLLWQITGKQWLISIGAAAGVPGAAMAANAGQGSGLLGNVGTSMAGNYVTSTLGASVFGNATAYGAVTGAGSAQAAMLAAQTGEFGIAGLAATGQAAGTAAGSALSSLSAAAPYIALGLAAVALIDSLDDSGTMHTGGLGGYSAKLGGLKGSAVSDAGLRFGVDAKDYTASSETAAAAMAKGVAGILDQTAATFGKSAGYYAATAFADDTSADGAWGALMVKLGDKVLLDWGNNPSAQGDANVPRVFADGEAGAKEYAAAVAGSIRDLLIEQTPDWADAMLTALGDAPTIDALAATVGQINQVQTALEGMGKASAAFAGLSEAATSALVQALGGAEAALAGLDTYYQNYYSEAERAAVVTANLAAELAAFGVQLPATRAQWREMTDAALAAGNTGLAAKLVQLSGAFASVTDAVQTTATAVAGIADGIRQAITAAYTGARTAAMSALQSAVARERTGLQTSANAASTLVGEVQTVFDTLAEAVQSLRADAGGVPAAQQGAGFISAALAQAQATGVLPDQQALADAINAARGGLGANNFASLAEQQFAQLKLAGELEGLQTVSGSQLTNAQYQLQVAESQLQALDDTLAYWQQQVSAAEGNVTATLSVGDAIRSLQVALSQSLDAGFTSISGLGQKTLQDQLQGVAAQYSPGTTASAVEQLTSSVVGGAIGLNDAVNFLSGTGATSRLFEEQVNVFKNFDAPGYYAEIRKNIDLLIGQGMSGQALSQTLTDMGVSLTDASKAYGVTPAEIAANLLRAGATTLPAFAEGGWHGGGWALVGERGPELAYMPPAQIYTAPQTAAMLGGGVGNTQQLERLVQGLTAEVQRLQALVGEGNRYARDTAATLDQVTEGGGAMRTTAA